MRIAIVTQEDPFYLPPALERLCRKQRKNLVCVIVLPAFNEPLASTARRLYDFYGPVDFVRLGCRFVFAKLADIINRLHPLTRAYSIDDVARRHDLPVYRPENVNAPAFLDILRQDIRPDLLVSIAASQILKRAVLEIPRHGCINLHSAPLPRYQGMMPNFWTLVHGEPEGMVTIHYMVEQLDAGDIILQRSVPIYPGDSLHNLMVRSKIVGVDTLIEAIELIDSGRVLPRPMDATKATYFSFPRRADAQRLRAQGRRLL